MKILYLTKYSRLGASSRMRSFQYFPHLQEQRMSVTVKPLFGDTYLKNLYNGRKSMISIVKAYIDRFFLLFTLFKYDRILIEKELFPFMPALAERIMHLFGLKYIVDYDDAIFHNYDQHPNKLLRELLKHKIGTVMRLSTVVIAGNDYLATKAREAGAKQVQIIPTVVDVDRYKLKQHNVHYPIVIGWIGTKSTFEKHLLKAKDWIKSAQNQYPVVFHIVGVAEGRDLGPGVHYFPWSEESEINAILKFDIGIMPLQDSHWEKGKCAYKLLQYMACGLPVIASPVGMNKEVVFDNLNGYCASTELEWLCAIEKYVGDVELRKKHGYAGREVVQNRFCLQVTQGIIYKTILKS